MPKTVSLGSFEGRTYAGGEAVLEFTRYVYFPLRKGPYEKAGEDHWPDKDRKPGIGLNLQILDKYDPGDLVVHDLPGDCFYLLEDRELVREYAVRKTLGDKVLWILPIFAFQEVEIQDEDRIPIGLALEG